MHISTDDYDIAFSPEQPEILQLTHTITGDTFTMTVTEAITWLRLMLTHRDELRHMKTGD